MQLTGREEFTQSPEVLWPRLTDLSSFARVLPRLEKVERAEPGRLECRVKPGLSFLTGTLRLTFEVTDQTPPRSARMRITGKGVGASVVVETSFQLEAIAMGTQLDWQSEVTELGGLLKPVSRGLIEAAALKVIADGWEGFRRDLAEA